MTPTKVHTIKGHTWSRAEHESVDHRIAISVYADAPKRQTDRYFLEYRGAGGLVRIRAEFRGELIRKVADAIHDGTVEVSDDFDLDQAIDGCELLLFEGAKTE